MATLTFTANNNYTGTARLKSGTNWDAIHDNPDGNGSTSAECQAETVSNSWDDYAYGIGRGFVVFNTSSLPDGATILSATLNMHQGTITNYGGKAMYVCSSSHTWGDTIDAEDYGEVGTTVYGSLPESAFNTGAGRQAIVTFTSTGRNAISKTGYTPMCLRTWYDLSDTAITLTKEVYLAFDGGTGTYPPRLVVTYAELPTVTTAVPSNINDGWATGGGNVTSAGGGTVSTRGVCWSTSANPTTSNSKAASGSGTGSYSVTMSGLLTGVTYHCRAYATNEAGTAYGGDIAFTTLVPGGMV